MPFLDAVALSKAYKRFDYYPCGMGHKLPPPAETPHIKTEAMEESMEFLKNVLGDELYSRVKAKVDAYNADSAHKDAPLKIVDLSAGEYVSKAKHSALETEANGYKTQLETLNGELTALKNKRGTDSDTKAALETLQTKYDTDIKALQEQIGKAKLDGALEAALAGSRARSTKAVRALLDMERVKLDGDTLIGLEDQLKALKASDPYLFESTVLAKTGMSHQGGSEGAAEKKDEANAALRAVLSGEK